MPGIGCKVLNSTHRVVGVDFHKNIPPPPPAGPLALPHIVSATMSQADPTTQKISKSVMAGATGGYALGRQHDLGRGTYHTGANALIGLVWLGSGNKAEFGVSTVKTDQGRLAVACIPFVGINLQLDCNDIPWMGKATASLPAPTSICIASFNTVLAGFTLRDFVAGLVAGLTDAVIVFVVSKIAGFIVEELAPALIGALLGPEALLAVGLVGVAFPVAFQVAQDGLEMLIGWGIGTPLGYSPNPDEHSIPIGIVSKYGGKLNEALNNWISPAPALSP